MSFWRTRKRNAVSDAPSRSTSGVPVGTDPCSEHGCVRQTGAPCGFVDRRGHPCGTSWCPEHGAAVEGASYCRRHAGIVGALLASTAAGSVPDLANRSPSLANWVANDIDEPIRDLLMGAARTAENLVVEPVTLLYYGVERERRWERSWKLVDHTGVAVKVSVEVDEATDPEVSARVANNIVAKGVPPWIEHRRRHEEVPEALGSTERQQFYSFLLQHITEGVRRERLRA